MAGRSLQQVLDELPPEAFAGAAAAAAAEGGDGDERCSARGWCQGARPDRRARREECRLCGRKFLRDRIYVHERICRKAQEKKKKRKVRRRRRRGRRHRWPDGACADVGRLGEARRGHGFRRVREQAPAGAGSAAGAHAARLARRARAQTPPEVKEWRENGKRWRDERQEFRAVVDANRPEVAPAAARVPSWYTRHACVAVAARAAARQHARRRCVQQSAG